jgi:hypothetical protein
MNPYTEFENFHQQVVVPAFVPGVFNGSANVTPVSIDRSGFNAVMLVVQAGSVTDGQTLTLQACDDDTNYVDVPAGEILGDLTGFKAVVAGDANKCIAIGYVGLHRYLQIGCTGNGGTGAALAAFAVLAFPRNAPAQS